MKKLQLLQTAILAVIILLVTISCEMRSPIKSDIDIPDFNIFPDGTVTYPTGTGGGGGIPTISIPYYESVVWTGNKFVAIGSSVIASEDGLTWEKLASSVGLMSLKKAVYIDTLIYALGGRFGGKINISTDGENWTTLFDSDEETYNDIIKNDSMLIIVGRTGSSGLILTSTNGIDWNRTILPEVTSYIKKIIFANSQYYAFGKSSVSYLGYVYTSSDAVNWAVTNMTDNKKYQDVEWFGDRFVTSTHAGSGTPEVYNFLTSSDGVNFTVFSSDSTLYNIYNIKKVGDKLFAFGNKFGISTSDDGINWKSVRLGNRIEDVCNDITWNGQRYVAVGKSSIFSSEDGYEWVR